MKPNIQIIILMTIGIVTSQLAHAGPPVKYPTCGLNTKIVSVPNGAGVFFDETCSVAYVLPPAKGKVELSGMAPNFNLKLCGAYESSLTALDNSYANLKKLSALLNPKSSNSTDTTIGDGTSIDGGTAPVVSTPVFTPIDPRILTEYQKTLDIIALTQKSLEMFSNDKQGVAVGKIDFTLDWNNLLEAYRSANPKIHFERLPLEAGRINFTRKLGTSGEVINGAVAYTIPGIENTSGVREDGSLSPTTGGVIMGDAISGQVVLNYAGACPLVVNGDIPSTVSASKLNSYLVTNFTYKYSLQGLKKYRASYNLASIAKHIEENHTSGGLFSSKTVNSLTETNSSSDEFSMTIESNQASFEYDANLRAEVKNELITRVITELAAGTGQNVVIPTQTAPPAHGATVAADALQKVPNLYAQVGAAVLRVADSIFGNSSAVAQYIKERNGVSVDDVTEKRMFPYEGTTIFSESTK